MKLAYPKARFGSQANIKSVKVDLPRQLPSQLKTLKLACPDSTFDANPASCDPESRIGTAKAATPLLPVPLTGPVYFVSHGGLKFPELVIVLSGYGTTVQLHAETFISKAGITSSTFRTIPDVPVGTFELSLPQGKYSALAAPNNNLCKRSPEDADRIHSPKRRRHQAEHADSRHRLRKAQDQEEEGHPQEKEVTWAPRQINRQQLWRRATQSPRLGTRYVHGAASGSLRSSASACTALFEVSAERGAGNVAVAHLVERAGVSRRTFYELFPDREECFLAGLEEAIECASRYVLDAYDPSARWVERLRTALTASLEFLDDERGMGQLLIVGSLGAGHRSIERRQCVIAQMASFVDQGRSESRTGADLPPLTAEGVLGAVMSVVHSRLLRNDPVRLCDLTSGLMSMVVLPYLGAAAARREFSRPPPERWSVARTPSGDPLRDIDMRLTYRTVRVLTSIAANPDSSNREVGIGAGMEDQGQISRLLGRLQRLDLIQNTRSTVARGAPNAWRLTERGCHVQRTIAERPARG